MILRVVRAVHWANALWYSRGGEVVKSLRALRKLKSITTLRPYEHVFEGVLLLRNRDFPGAKKVFRNVIEDTADERPNALYARVYANAMLYGMNGELGGEREAWAQAAAIPCDPALRRWLPIQEASNVLQ
jgi:hypothetical protein